MVSARARLIFRVAMVALVFLVVFYVGRPLYWKVSATIHDIRANKQTVSGGISQFVYDAQRSVGWFRDESDSGERTRKSATSRRFLLIRQIILDGRRNVTSPQNNSIKSGEVPI